ncbi:MAG: hypothetical protein AABY73_01395 [Pseudomonadota bacterium]
MKIFEYRYVEVRREIDMGSPKGWKERRRAVERRMPQVEEITLEEWVFLAEAYASNTESSEIPNDATAGLAPGICNPK